MTTFLSMADAIYTTNLPDGQDVYAGYTGGQWPTYRELAALHPGKRLFAFAISAGEWGDALDIERGDATIDQAPGWARDIWRPVNVTLPHLYINANNVQALVDRMTAAGFARTAYVVGSAHYGHGLHICGPATCNQTGGAATADWTQWYSGNAFDLSTIPADLFAPQEDDVTPADITTITTSVQTMLREEFAPGAELYDRVIQGVLAALAEDGTVLQAAAAAALKNLPAATGAGTITDNQIPALGQAIVAALAAAIKAS